VGQQGARAIARPSRTWAAGDASAHGAGSDAPALEGIKRRLELVELIQLPLLPLGHLAMTIGPHRRVVSDAPASSPESKACFRGTPVAARAPGKHTH